MQRNDEEQLSLIYLDDLNRKLDELIKLQKQVLLSNSPLGGTVKFTDPYQHRLVVAGRRNEEIYMYDIEREFGGSKVALINRIGSDWFPNTVVTLRIDGKDTALRVPKATVQDPLSVNLIAERVIQWRVDNNDVADHDFAVLTDGCLIDKEIWDHLKEVRDEFVAEQRALS